MTREEQLTAMRPRDLIALADRLGVRVAASKNRVNLKEKKSDVVARILFAEDGNDAVDAMPVETVDSTPQEDAESDSANQAVEFVGPEQEFDLRAFLTGAECVDSPIFEYLDSKVLYKNGAKIGTVTVAESVVTVTVDAGDGFNVYIVPLEEYKAVKAEIG